MDLAGSSIFTQIVITVAITAAIFFLYLVVYQMIQTFEGYSTARIAIIAETSSSCESCSNQASLCTNPCNPNCTVLPLSENQLTGVEFSYTGFVYITPATDDSTDTWKTIFYKGYGQAPFPLCAPGVFVSGTNASNGTPTLRVVMNTYDNWFNTIDVNQIPFNKWFHLALVLRNNAMEVYVNGNLANKMTFKGTLPYQNYEGVQVFSGTTLPASLFNNSQTSTSGTMPSTNKMGVPPGENMAVSGSFNGYLSRLYYFSYALTYSEIMSMMNQGPSSSMSTCNNMDKPPYLIDSWWTQKKN
jgi:Concanavalin A-like lectin/glucanases superfamily